MSLSFDSITQLFKSHPALRLLRAENAPLILSFFDRAFIQPNIRYISQSNLASMLDDMLYRIRDAEGQDAFPRSAQSYLDDWSHNDRGWLRRFYPHSSDEPHYDLAPSVEKTMTWIESLSARAFVGTESRLLTIFELLRQMVLGAEEDAETRITELEKKKKQLDDEIAAIRRGELEIMDQTALRDRFMQFSAMARELLSDFRTVDHNFRQLDGRVREKIAAWDGSKGALLEEIFGERDAITGSDQGRSFRAFWDFLMAPQSQDELTALIEKVFALDAIAGFSEEFRLKRIHFDWLDAGEHTQRTVANLSSQLRRYLDNRVYLENKRIMGILDSISTSALSTKMNVPQGDFMSVEDSSAEIRLPMERRMYSSTQQGHIPALVQDADGADIDYQALLDQTYVDRSVLLSNIKKELNESGQIPLHSLLKRYPISRGLAELIAYISIASESPFSVFDEERRELVEWRTASGVIMRAYIPYIILNRSGNDGAR